MTWSTYAGFAAMMALLAMMPGPDTMVVLKNALTGGARGGGWACGGISVANFLQGTAAALGLGAVITRYQPVFVTVKWLGAAYLVYLGVQALRGAWRGDYEALDDVRRARASRARRFREGFLSNITNPKVIVLYLSVLPQFLTPGVTDQGDALLLAYTVAALGVVWQVLLLLFVHRVRGWLQQRKVRRAMDGVTGTALLGFGAALALEG
ncbi:MULTISPECIES: LysE family translocator [unclassified Amycolatopsis]|uniref:LysE family translocator n=1 Tax=unclassified Amycolatopsis TaxID=2618356 RepID=UPI001FF4D1F1|nr:MULTISPECIES: LysE family translocator [unclassified Amycolatopsis]UOZ07429.1 LysE family translocator [Amycolatopsis sp. WQ 127309]WSJ73693.1 LysE family translocator [Amycolatopsis sp. NBC_01307]WSK82650.1 LysE family translocator [Amycolatopsis sp. NBC_01286]